MLPHLRPTVALAFCVLVVFVGIFVSGYFGLYNYWVHLDTSMHFLGGLGVAWFGLAILQDDITRLNRWKQLLILVSFAALVGVLWEFAEYMVGFGRDVVPWLWRWFHGGSLTDTLFDLAADLVGAMVLTLWALRKAVISE